MSDLLSGKIAIVTGGANGIGRASAIAMAREGATVVVADMNDAGGEETVGLITAEGGRASYRHCDVTDEASVAGLVQHTVDTHGRRPSSPEDTRKREAMDYLTFKYVAGHFGTHCQQQTERERTADREAWVSLRLHPSACVEDAEAVGL